MSKALQNVNVFNAGKKRDEALKEIGRYLPDYYKLVEQTKSIDGYVTELEAKIKEQEQKIENTNDFASAQYARVRALNERLAVHEAEIKKLQAERDKAQKIVDALPPEIKKQLKGAKRHDYER